jgi:hypothetical protein
MKTIPPAPALAALVFKDPTGSRSCVSLIRTLKTDILFYRRWIVHGIQLTPAVRQAMGIGWNSTTTFKAGDGPALHVPFGATWEWSTIDPDIVYYLKGKSPASDWSRTTWAAHRRRIGRLHGSGYGLTIGSQWPPVTATDTIR